MIYSLIILLPFLSFLSGSLFGTILGIGVCYISITSIFLTWCLSLHLFFNILKYNTLYKITFGNWISSENFDLDWCFCLDSLTSVLLVIVTFISMLVHLYSSEYMRHDPHLMRFMSYLSLFTLFMILLVTANNYLQMFVGWEGVGFCSYLLINFWFTRIQANKAAIKAMLVNRIGDFFILLALFLIYSICNSLDYDIVFTMAPYFLNYNFIFLGYEIPSIDLICLFLFLGAMGKSAQLGLHTWLPDAMEGPTPVSALIHAATMVTAGVFLLARCSFLFELSPLILNFIMFIGATTAFFAATTGLFQNDLKKVIAYSTCSQLGYMIFACGLSSYDVGVFHLSNHAFFKALLFLGAGSIIHSVADEQDLRKLGGLKNLLPFSYSIMLIGSLALIGFPFLSGFYSKDTILEIAFAKYTYLSHFCYTLGSLAAFCTAFYSTRLLFLVFLAEPNGNRKIILNAHESSWHITLPLFLLTLCSILIGFFTKEFFIGFGGDFWNFSIFILPQNYLLLDIEFINFFFKILPLLLTLLGVWSAYTIYVNKLEIFYKIKLSKNFKYLYTFFSKKWYFDRIYNQFISQNFLFLGYFLTYKNIDRGLLENIGPFGLTNNLNIISNKLKYLQSGSISQYLLIFLITIFLLIYFINILTYFI
jgi:proton-translocating NADH-quinone oxidoreductase chain L